MRSTIAVLAVMFMVACSAIPFEDGRGGGSGGGTDGGGGDDTNVQCDRVQFTMPLARGTVKITDKNDGSMPPYSLPIRDEDNFFVNPCGHTRGAVPGIEINITDPQGKVLGCDAGTKGACGELMYANGIRIFCEPVGNPVNGISTHQTCDGVKLANCFCKAEEMNPR